jgi:hypothetical protein
MRPIFHITSAVRIPASFSASVKALLITRGSGLLASGVAVSLQPPAASNDAKVIRQKNFFIIF